MEAAEQEAIQEIENAAAHVNLSDELEVEEEEGLLEKGEAEDAAQNDASYSSYLSADENINLLPKCAKTSILILG